jgi:hypothetical protein
MHRSFALALGITGLVVSATAQALVCAVPGTTVSWATDQCLLETDATDPKSKLVTDCLLRANTIRQPCEWNIIYKRKYCETLIGKEMFHGALEECVADPAMIGPSVIETVRHQPGKT